MDLNTITEVARPRSRADLQALGAGDAWLAGGTWLFSEPQPKLTRLVDLAGLNWPPLEFSANGLRIGATCTLAQLAAAEMPIAWRAAPLFRQCCRALLGSFKIWNAATVGGNLCMALPAGPMVALATALDGVCTIWTPAGGTPPGPTSTGPTSTGPTSTGRTLPEWPPLSQTSAAAERLVPASDFVQGPQQNVLRAGELLRAVSLPMEALQRRTAFRQISLTPLGRSAALLIGTLSLDEAFALTVTAATRRPVLLCFPDLPTAAVLRDALEHAIPAAQYYDDPHGAPEWRRHMTLRFAEQIRQELSASAPP